MAERETISTSHRLGLLWVRLAGLIVPRAWRDTVLDDLVDEASRQGKSEWWVGTEAIRAGLGLRRIVNGDVMLTDLRYAIRSLVQARWFTVGAVLTFTLGIGVNAAVFAAVDRMLFRQLPYERPAELVLMQEYDLAKNRPAAGTVLATYVAHARQLDAFVDGATMYAFGDDFSLSIDPGDEPRLTLLSCSYNALALLGVRPYIGRDFNKDDVVARRRVALISYDVWRNQFGSRPDVSGQKVWSNREATEVIGVLPRDFIPAAAQLSPDSDGLVMDFTDFVTRNPNARMPPPVLRLKRGVSIAAAQSQVDAMIGRLRAGDPAPPPVRIPTGFRLVRVDDALFSYYGSSLWLVVIASALVFLVACANMASLMLVRGRSREKQHAVRLALGATRARLIRAELSVSLCLALLGSISAELVLLCVNRGLGRVLPPVFNRFSASVIDLRVVAALAVFGILAGIVAGALPAIRASRVDVLTSLQNYAGRSSSSRAGGRSLLVMEAALCVVLVGAAAATSRSLIGLLRTELGFSPVGLYSVRAVLPRQADPEANFAQYASIAPALARVDKVKSVAAANELPVFGSIPERQTELGPDGVKFRVGPGLLEGLGAHMLAGRTFSTSDVASRARVGIVNATAMAEVWPGATPAQVVGRFLDINGELPVEVIGVVGDMRAGARMNVNGILFVPLSPTGFRFMSFVVRTVDGSKPSLVGIRRELTAQGLTPTGIRVDDVARDVSDGVREDRFRAILFGTFGVCALLLAVVGLYAVASFDVALRQRELGVRLAFGATPQDLCALLIRQAVRPVLWGSAIGIAIAVWAARFLQSFLTGVDAKDPLTFAVVALLLAGTAAAAAWIPARRAARTDPSIVLRAN
jgi:predicted permease